MGDAEYTQGPFRSGKLTPPPKVPFNWKPVTDLLGGCVIFLGILVMVGAIFAFFISISENMEIVNNTEAREITERTGQCASFCQEEGYQYWNSRRGHERGTIDCVCARPETHRSQRFLCRILPNSPIVCVYN